MSDMLEEAVTSQEDQDYDRAIEEFQKFLTKYPDSRHATGVQFELANSYRRKGDYKSAIDAYAQVPQESGLFNKAILLTGDSYLALGDGEKAREAYSSILEKYPFLNNEVAREAKGRIATLNRIAELERGFDEAEQNHKDNYLFEIARIYLEELSLFDVAAEKFRELREKYPDSELADDALLMIGNAFWSMGTYETPPKVDTGKLNAFVRYHYILDRYPQLAQIDLNDTKVKPHWPSGYPSVGYENLYGKSKRYDNYYLEVRMLLSRYRDLKAWRYTDFLPPSYAKAMDTWHELFSLYPESDAAIEGRELVAKKLVELGKAFYNAGAPKFSSILLHKSLAYQPTPMAHIYLARFYADAMTFGSSSSYYKIKVFDHIKEAESMVSSNSALADEIKILKTWMNYRIRLEGLEVKVNRLSSR